MKDKFSEWRDGLLQEQKKIDCKKKCLTPT